MGLDQYLVATKLVSGGDWRTDEEKKQFADLMKAVKGKGISNKSEYPSASIGVNVGYWRKANQIHGWFVENVQDGEDDCREHDVSRDKLRELLALCELVKQNKDKAEELLPPSRGCFFGSDGVDEWYWQDIDSTIEMLSYVLEKVGKDWYLSYRASW